MMDNNEEIRVENQNSQLTKVKKGDKVQDDYFEGQVRFNDTSKNEGKLEVKFSLSQKVWDSYNVLATDYTSYAVVYSCRTSFFG